MNTLDLFIALQSGWEGFFIPSYTSSSLFLLYIGLLFELHFKTRCAVKSMPEFKLNYTG